MTMGLLRWGFLSTDFSLRVLPTGLLRTKEKHPDFSGCLSKRNRVTGFHFLDCFVKVAAVPTNDVVALFGFGFVSVFVVTFSPSTIERTIPRTIWVRVVPFVMSICEPCHGLLFSLVCLAWYKPISTGPFCQSLKTLRVMAVARKGTP
jgi:hypothetical protein